MIRPILNHRSPILVYGLIGLLGGWLAYRFLPNGLSGGDGVFSLRTELIGSAPEPHSQNPPDNAARETTANPLASTKNDKNTTVNSMVHPSTLTAESPIAAQDRPNNHKQSKWKRKFDEQQKIAVEVRTDPEARKQTLERYFSTEDPDLRASLGSALASSNDPEIEAAALRIAQQGSTPQQRLSALNLLSQSQNQDTATRTALIDLLRTDTGTNERITIESLTALTPRGPLPENEQRDVVNAIKAFSTSPNPRIREQGLKSLAEWAPQEETVLQTVTQGAQDNDPLVRRSAVQTLGQAGFRFSDVREALLTKLLDAQEDFDVRMTAWRALQSFPLDPQAYSAYSDFKNTYPTQTGPH